MSEHRFATGGAIPSGPVYVAPKGTELIMTPWQWELIGRLATMHPEDATVGISRATRSVHRSVTFQQLPPKTRRERRQRNAFMRMIYGGPLPLPVKRRQLIHKGGKP